MDYLAKAVPTLGMSYGRIPWFATSSRRASHGRSVAMGSRAVHLRVAEAAEPVDWRIAGRHYLAAGEQDDARRVLAAAIENILATGAYAAAEELSSSLTSGGLAGAPGLVLRSRLAQQRAAADEGLELAEQAWSVDAGSTAVLLNLVTARTLVGDLAGALDAGRLLEKAAQPELAALGRVYQRTMETSVSGSLDVAIRELEDLCHALRSRGDTHFLGVALSNLAYIGTAMSRPQDALGHADEAIACLSATSAGVELVSARLARAAALAYLGDIEAARLEARPRQSTRPRPVRRSSWQSRSARLRRFSVRQLGQCRS